MAKGGKRPGAGRPRGAPTRRKRAVALKAAAEGISPIEVMLGVMKAAYSQAVNETGQITDMKAATLAADLAKDAAPYVHPRLSSIDARVKHSLEDLSDDDLDRRIAQLQSGEDRTAPAAGGEA